MTMLGQSLDIGGALIAAMKAHAPLLAFIPAPRIYPEITPAQVVWPFIKLGAMTETPTRHDGLADTVYGTECIGAVHVFAKASAAAPDPSAFCKRVNGVVSRLIEGMENVVINGEPSLSFRVDQIIEIADGEESGARHGIVTWTAYAV